jgi:hypothetical protein
MITRSIFLVIGRVENMPVNTDPSPGQIAAACLQIQAGWSEREKLSRLRSDLRPQYTRCDGETEEMSSSVYDDHHERRAELQAMAGG